MAALTVGLLGIAPLEAVRDDLRLPQRAVGVRSFLTPTMVQPTCDRLAVMCFVGFD